MLRKNASLWTSLPEQNCPSLNEDTPAIRFAPDKSICRHNLNRKTIGVCHKSIHMEKCQTPNSNVISKHDRYLISLEKHNKYLKGIKTKSKTDEELEKRERAFSPYVNGANAAQPCISPRKKKRKLLSTVIDSRASTLEKEDHHSLVFIPRPKSVSNLPSQSLSVKPRKFWGQGSIQIKAEVGNTLRAARENLDHSYIDDFEECDSSDENAEETIDPQLKWCEDEEIIPEVLSTRKCWKDALRISSRDIICEDILENTNNLNINCDDIPILGQTCTTNIS